jgi:hypothetical protein
VDADTGEVVENENIVKGYKVDTDTYIQVTKEELENVALESTRTIEIDEFVDRSEIDPRMVISGDGTAQVPWRTSTAPYRDGADRSGRRRQWLPFPFPAMTVKRPSHDAKLLPRT